MRSIFSLSTSLPPSLKTPIVILSICLVTGCASALKDTEALPTQQPSLEQTDQTTIESATDESTAGPKDAAAQQKAALLAALPQKSDPMQKSLPLDLIKVYDQATSLRQNNQWEAALEQLKLAQVQFPLHSGPSYRVARMQFEAKQWDAAIESLDAAISINPDNYYAYNLKGVVLREKGQFEAAKAAYLKAIAIYPRYPQAHLNLAILADIYLYDLTLALQHYEYFVALSQDVDKKVNGWIVDLKRRMPAQSESP